MQRTYKFRLYPNSTQSTILQHTLGVCKWVHNKMVEKILSEGFQTRNDLCYFLTSLKEQESWLYSYHSKMLQMVAVDLDSAQKSLIQLRKNGHKTGKLKFTKFSEYGSFTYNQSGFEIKDNYLHLSKLGRIRITCHRPISQSNVTIKQITISRSKTSKWYACVLCEIDALLPKISITKSIGIDVGIRNFAYDSSGFVTPNPLILRKMSKPLIRIQRKIFRRQKGSQNRRKAIRFYRIIQERIRNKRRDFLHKLSTQYARKFDVVFLERLQKLNMVRNHGFAKNILDSSWGIFGKMLDYKTILIEISARNTTINCSRCGNVVPKSLFIRIHNCHICGLVLDRDHNAAINILKKGLEVFGINHTVPQELRELTPVEIHVGSLKQEATIFTK